MTTAEYMTRSETRAHRSHMQHGRTALGVGVAFFAFILAAFWGNGFQMATYLWGGVAVVTFLLGLAAVYFSAAGRVVRDEEI